MSSWARMRERYLRDGVPVRLGGLAANLLRIGSFADRPEHGDVVVRLVRESALFIEWTAGDIQGDELIDLAHLQRELLQWYRNWESIWADGDRRAAVATGAAQWSRRLLEMSGLGAREA
jgi:hypothetical protein